MTTSKPSGDGLPKPSAFITRHLRHHCTPGSVNSRPVIQLRSHLPYHQPLHHPLLAHRVIWARLQPSRRCSPPSTRPTSLVFRPQVPRAGQNISFVTSICASVEMVGIEYIFISA